MTVNFEAEVISWRGPAPFVYAVVPEAVSREIRALAGQLSYGWGCIPVTATLGGTTWTTALFPKDGLYRVPLKVVVQRAEGVEVGQVRSLSLSLT